MNEAKGIPEKLAKIINPRRRKWSGAEVGYLYISEEVREELADNGNKDIQQEPYASTDKINEMLESLEDYENTVFSKWNVTNIYLRHRKDILESIQQSLYFAQTRICLEISNSIIAQEALYKGVDLVFNVFTLGKIIADKDEDTAKRLKKFTEVSANNYKSLVAYNEAMKLFGEFYDIPGFYECFNVFIGDEFINTTNKAMGTLKGLIKDFTFPDAQREEKLKLIDYMFKPLEYEKMVTTEEQRKKARRYMRKSDIETFLANEVTIENILKPIID